MVYDFSVCETFFPSWYSYEYTVRVDIFDASKTNLATCSLQPVRIIIRTPSSRQTLFINLGLEWAISLAKIRIPHYPCLCRGRNLRWHLQCHPVNAIPILSVPLCCLYTVSALSTFNLHQTQKSVKALRIIAPLLFVLSLSFFGCNGKSHWQQNYKGKIEATLNGGEWFPLMVSKIDDHDGTLNILFDIYSAKRLTSSLTITYLPNTEGSYPLVMREYSNPKPSASYDLLDNDILIKSFYVDTTYMNNHVEITSYSTFWNRVKGSFEVKLIKAGSEMEPRTDDNTIVVVCKEFSTSIER